MRYCNDFLPQVCDGIRITNPERFYLRYWNTLPSKVNFLLSTSMCTRVNGLHDAREAARALFSLPSSGQMADHLIALLQVCWMDFKLQLMTLDISVETVNFVNRASLSDGSLEAFS